MAATFEPGRRGALLGGAALAAAGLALPRLSEAARGGAGAGRPSAGG